MKPLNLDNRPCSPISSNCVIWQGPDIPCIKLCTGDTVSDVVFKLGTELCTIMDQLKVTNYDLSCLNLTACPPEDFQVLIQLLINRICELNGITPTEPGKSSGCPDCVVSVAPCLIQNGQTTMQLIDYVQMIANRVCSIISEIENINNQITVINSTLVDLQYQIDNLPTYTLPSFEVNCILSGVQPLDAIVNALMNNNNFGYCALLNSTGTPAEINTAVLTQCILDADQPLSALALTPPVTTTFSAYYAGSWVNAVTLGANPTVANAINNIWVAVCDMYNYVSSLDTGITVQDTTTVNLTYTSGTLSAAVQDTGWHCLEGFDFYSTASDMIVPKPQVRRIGNVLHFRGEIIVPINNSGTVLQYYYKAGLDTYEGTTSAPYNNKAPFTGAGGVSLLSGGSLAFNNNNSCIPSSVLPAGYSLDGVYTTTWQIGSRNMRTGSCCTALTTVIRPGIRNNGALVLALFADTEESIQTGCNPGAYNTSHLSYIISNVTKEQNVTDFKSTINVYDSTATGNQNAQPFFKTGETYPITINANDNADIGGFKCRLDGLMAFIGPCVTTIPTPVLDANACAGTCAVR